MKIIALDGPDGSGKSTQVALLRDYLGIDLGYDVEQIQMPGASCLGKDIRKLVKNPELRIAPVASRLLFQADTAQLFWEMSQLKALPDFAVCARWSPITDIIYGEAEGLDRPWLDQLQTASGTKKQCDLYFLFVISAEEAHVRKEMMKRAGYQETCRIENLGESFLGKVAAGYKQAADNVSLEHSFGAWLYTRALKVIVIDASLERDIIRDQIREHVKQEFNLGEKKPNE